MQHVVICYDVTKNRRRNRLAKALVGQMDRVQKSVFEGRLPEPRLEKLLPRIGRLIDLETDSLRIYRLCKRCARNVEVLGAGMGEIEDPEDVLL